MTQHIKIETNLSIRIRDFFDKNFLNNSILSNMATIRKSSIDIEEQLKLLKTYAPSIWSHKQSLKSIHLLGAILFMGNVSLILYKIQNGSRAKQDVGIGEQLKL